MRTVAWRLAAIRWRSVRRWLSARARLGAQPPALGSDDEREEADVDTHR